MCIRDGLCEQQQQQQVAGFGKHNPYLRADTVDAVRVTPAQIAASVDASLARLGTDHIDLLQIHWCVCAT